MRLSATPWNKRTQLPLGFFGRTFQPRRSTPSGARTSKSSRVEPVTAKEESASRMRSGVSSRRIGWRHAGPASDPATAAKRGGKSNKIRAMRIRRGRMGPIRRYDNEGTPVRTIVGASISKPPVFLSVLHLKELGSLQGFVFTSAGQGIRPGRTVRDNRKRAVTIWNWALEELTRAQSEEM